MDVLVQILIDTLYALPHAFGNMLVVLAAAISATLAVSFFNGHVVTIKTLYLVIIMVTGTFSVLLGIAGGITYFVLAQRRHEPNQRELAVLFSLILFVLGGWFGLLPGLSAVPTIGEVHR
jgi:hypothetical protein